MTSQRQQQLMMDCFTQSKPCICGHVYGLKFHRDEYLKQLFQYRQNPTIWSSVSHAIKARVMAALHLCSEHKELEDILPHLEITDIEKACTILDRAREARQLKKKIEIYERQNPHHLMTIPAHKNEEKKENEGNNHNDTPMGEEGNGDDSQEQKERQRTSKSFRKITKYRRNLEELQLSLELGEAGSGGSNKQQHHHQTEPCAIAHESSAVKELIQSGSVSGSLARKIKKWASKSLQPDFLEFVMLEMPKKTWQRVADLVHFSPKDFPVPYFLADVFGESIPEDSFVFSMRQLKDTAASSSSSSSTATNDVITVFRQMSHKFPQVYDSYAYLRTQSTLLRSKEVVEDLAKHIPLNLVIWYFEELYGTSKACGKILEDRLLKEEEEEHNVLLSTTITNNAASNQSSSKVYTYGKLLERILTFRKMRLNTLADLLIHKATGRLKYMKEQASSHRNHNAKTVVFGDASSSMQCAIESATILAAMVSSCLDAELSFFAGKLVPSPHNKPVTVKETLEVCNKVRACGCTSLAVALWPYFHNKIHIDTIVMVTDEEENTNSHGYSFATLLKAYKTLVNPNVALIVVCVGTGDRRFRKSLVENDIVCKTVSIDGSRPDLTKFDTLLSEIAIMSKSLLVKEDEEKEKDESASTEGGDRDDFVMVE